MPLGFRVCATVSLAAALPSVAGCGSSGDGPGKLDRKQSTPVETSETAKPVLDISKAETGVRDVLTDEENGYGINNVEHVKCNNGEDPVIRKGDTFDCDVVIDGQYRLVTVTFQDDSGTYEVGRPR